MHAHSMLEDKETLFSQRLRRHQTKATVPGQNGDYIKQDTSIVCNSEQCQPALLLIYWTAALRQRPPIQKAVYEQYAHCLCRLKGPLPPCLQTMTHTAASSE